LNISAYDHFFELLKRPSPEIFHGKTVSKSTTSQLPDGGYIPEGVSYSNKPAFLYGVMVVIIKRVFY
jgi:hypothetical protein